MQAMTSLESYLRHKNLPQLLRICAALSCYDYFSPFSDPRSFKNYINYPKLRTFAAAVLKSGSPLASSKYVTQNGLRKALNDALDAGYDPAALNTAMSLSGKPGVELEFHRFFARMGNIQILHQEHNSSVSYGRSIAMLERLPETKRDWLSPTIQEIAGRITSQIVLTLGARVGDLALVHAVLLHLYQKIFGQYLEISQRQPGDQQFLQLLDMMLDLSYTTSPFGFSAREIAGKYGSLLTSQDVDAFLRVFSRDVLVHRELLGSSAYQYGHVAWQLSPLDRFPVVSVSEAEQIIPSVTIFAKSLPYVIDYTLFEELGKVGLRDEYSAFRGAMQEVYLRDLVESRLKESLCIPERAYGREHRHGPDLTIVDGNRLIVVESKSRRMLASTVSLMSDESLRDNLRESYDALTRLPRKIEELYMGLPEYANVQSSIDATKGTQPICVVVLSDLVFSLSEIVRLQSSQDPKHAVRDFPYPFCLISLETFERAVEIAASNGPGLAELLEEHWQVSGTFDPSSPIADMFKGRQPPSSKARFASAFVKEAWREKESAIGAVGSD